MSRNRAEAYIRMWGLGMAVGTIAAAVVLSGSCFFDTKTNLCEASGRRCAPGQVCAIDQDACIPVGGCGDGIVNAARGEVCDDGNIRNGDNCSSDCTTDELCGNGAIDPGEECDGAEDSPSCDSDCTYIKCGDGHTNRAAGEGCDSNGLITQDCNGPICTVPVCGDNYYNKASGEECDKGGDAEDCNGNTDPELDAICKKPRCGDGYHNPLFTPPEVGAKPEACDTRADSQKCNGDGNGISSNSSAAKCQIPRCGDGYVNAKFAPVPNGDTEECDEGSNTSTCNGNDNQNGYGNCRAPSCGDGYVNGAYRPPGATRGEECDKGGDNPEIPCSNSSEECTELCQCRPIMMGAENISRIAD